ncbi:hypothetical protein GZH47_27830 [Paenibacillus rhizovicinus]|uniref:CBS domain-containing protein n=1 Tax=Paenibacillus rhizovicinus TaxID=2704463 RepID=A0A6C0P6M3_9BACL|nr:DUF294 nucleotidyltransferase-like domain-containing protein [Paenibacillus rhizovicinus]QHW34230.1 hypothetical protein GZH47_27830 [Paenibacillus rhizovicinus]
MSDPIRAQLLARIGRSDDAASLRGLRDQIHEHMEALLAKQTIEQFYTDLNEVHDAMIKRAVALSEEQMARLGHGSPPVPYAYLLFGSGGRAEQTLTSDQDSGLIYADPEEPSQLERNARYFELLSQKVVHLLEQLGYPPCEGEVVSSNPLWSQSSSQWKSKLDLWFREPDWERVRYLLIVADCRIVAGSQEIGEELKSCFFQKMLDHERIAERMLNNTMRHKVLVGVFGQLFKEHYGEDAGSLDLKYGAYIPMVNAVRLLAIQAGISETSTIARLERLTDKGILDASEGSQYAEAFRLLLRLRLMTTVKLEEGFYANNGKLPNTRLTKELIEELKAGLRTVKKLQKRVRKRASGRI